MIFAILFLLAGPVQAHDESRESAVPIPSATVRVEKSACVSDTTESMACEPDPSAGGANAAIEAVWLPPPESYTSGPKWPRLKIGGLPVSFLSIERLAAHMREQHKRDPSGMSKPEVIEWLKFDHAQRLTEDHLLRSPSINMSPGGPD